MKITTNKIILTISIILILVSIIGYISLYSASVDLRPDDHVITHDSLKLYCESMVKNEQRTFMPLLLFAGGSGIFSVILCEEFTGEKGGRIIAAGMFGFYILVFAIGALPVPLKRLSDISDNEPIIQTLTVNEKYIKGDNTRHKEYYFTLSGSRSYMITKKEYNGFEKGDQVYAIICGDTCVAVLDPEICSIERSEQQRFTN